VHLASSSQATLYEFFMKISCALRSSPVRAIYTATAHPAASQAAKSHAANQRVRALDLARNPSARALRRAACMVCIGPAWKKRANRLQLLQPWPWRACDFLHYAYVGWAVPSPQQRHKHCWGFRG
jgi:hypothetical protein